MELNLSPSSVPGRFDENLFTKIMEEKARLSLLHLEPEIVDAFTSAYLAAVKREIHKVLAFGPPYIVTDRLIKTLQFEIEVDLTDDVAAYFNSEGIAEYCAANQAVAVPIPEVAQEDIDSYISYTIEELKIRKQFKKMKFAPAKILDSRWQPDPDSKGSKAKVRVFSVKWKSTKLSKAEYDVLVKMKAEKIGDFKDAILTELNRNRYRLDWKDSDTFESYFERNDEIVKEYLAKCRKERGMKSSRGDVSGMLRKN